MKSAAIAFGVGMAAALSAHATEPVEQQLDRLIRKHTNEPTSVATPLPTDAQPITLANPAATAATNAMREAKNVCDLQGGEAVSSRIVKSGSVKFIQSIKCAKGEDVLWYLDFEAPKVVPMRASGGDLVQDVSLSIKRLMPTDPPQAPILLWSGVQKPDGETDAKTVDAGLDRQFGFRYAWRFKPQTIKQLELVWRPVNSGLLSENAKTWQAEFRRNLEHRADCVEPGVCSATWTFDAPGEREPGLWNLGLVADGVPIVSTVFFVRQR